MVPIVAAKRHVSSVKCMQMIRTQGEVTTGPSHQSLTLLSFYVAVGEATVKQVVTAGLGFHPRVPQSSSADLKAFYNPFSKGMLIVGLSVFVCASVKIPGILS